MVTVRCNGEEKIWESREEAINFFLEGVLACEGSEQARYAEILGQLTDGCDYCTDEAA